MATEKSNDSSNISDIDDMRSVISNMDEVKNIECSTEDEYIKNVVMDRIIKYIKLDEIIKKKEDSHRKLMKYIKESRGKLEEFIIMYLDKIDEEYIMVGKQHKLTKRVKENKGAIKPDNIENVIRNEFKARNLCKTDQELNQIVDDFIKNIESGRQIKIKKTLVRSNPEAKKGRKPIKQPQ